MNEREKSRENNPKSEKKANKKRKRERYSRKIFQKGSRYEEKGSRPREAAIIAIDGFCAAPQNQAVVHLSLVSLAREPPATARQRR